MGDAQHEVNLVQGIDSDSPFPVTRRRWIVLAVYSLVLLVNNGTWINLNAIATTMEFYYDKPEMLVSWVSSSNMAFLAVFSIPGHIIYTRIGFRDILIVSAAINSFALALRILGLVQFGIWIQIAASIVNALSASLCLLMTTQVSGLWFPVKERGLSTGICNMAILLGIAMAYAMSMFGVTLLQDRSAIFHDLMIVLGVQFVVSFFSLILAVAYVADSAHSLTGQQASSCRSALGNWKEFVVNTRSLFRLTRAILIMFVASVNYLIGSVILSLLNDVMIDAFPDNVSMIGTMAALMIGSGVLLSPIVGWLLDKFGRFPLLSSLLAFITAGSLGLFWLALFYPVLNYFSVAFVSGVLFSAFSFGYLVVSTAYLGVTLVPLPESLSVCWIYVMANTITTIMTASVTPWLRPEYHYYVLLGFVLLQMFAFLISLVEVLAHYCWSKDRVHC